MFQSQSPNLEYPRFPQVSQFRFPLESESVSQSARKYFWSWFQTLLSTSVSASESFSISESASISQSVSVSISESVSGSLSTGFRAVSQFRPSSQRRSVSLPRKVSGVGFRIVEYPVFRSTSFDLSIRVDQPVCIGKCFSISLRILVYFCFFRQ